MAHWYTANRRDRLTEHPTAADAVIAGIWSGFVRRLGAPATSRVYWPDHARHAARARRPRIKPENATLAPRRRPTGHRRPQF